jgi:Tfp pilus assembly protein PilE
MNLEFVIQFSSIIIAIAALIIAWQTANASKRQAEQTERQAKLTQEALVQEKEFTRANTVMHFTQSFFNLIEKMISQFLKNSKI